LALIQFGKDTETKWNLATYSADLHANSDLSRDVLNIPYLGTEPTDTIKFLISRSFVRIYGLNLPYLKSVERSRDLLAFGWYNILWTPRNSFDHRRIVRQ